MKKSIIGAVLVVMCVGTVFAVNREKSKACAPSSGTTANKDGLELVKPGTPSSGNTNVDNKDKNNKDKNNKDKNDKDNKKPCVTKKPSATKKPCATKKPSATKKPCATKKPSTTKKPCTTKEPSTGSGNTEDAVNKDGLELVKPGEDIGTGETTTTVNVGTTTENKYMKYKKGTVSHVCYLYIDQYGNVKYASKDDDVGGKTSVTLPCKKGYTLAVFVKQSTSGMIWFQNKVSDSVVDKVVAEVKKCDKSYKGHSSVAFGDGDYKWSYSTNGGKKQTVSYSFCK